ncbi:Myc-type, basic helix-loop-helix domain-containing protein [Pilobolus umbonatus]|nr:Myc-type, basic helix-loop-helix domain-containing protein [Pilobolus umbonatus]
MVCATSSQDSFNMYQLDNTQPLFLNFSSDLSPQKTSNKKKERVKKQTAYKVNGINILNRNDVDSKTAIERIQRRRANHNCVERRRRDNMNNTIFELSIVVPNAAQLNQKPNKGKILKLSLDYIKQLKAENNALKESLDGHQKHHPFSPISSSSSVSSTSSSIPNMFYHAYPKLTPSEPQFMDRY